MAFLTKVPGVGQFMTITVDGMKVPGIQQEKLEDCGPSCVGLVLRMARYDGADTITPANLRAASQLSVGGYRPAVDDVVQEAPSPAMHALAAIMKGAIGGRGTGTYAVGLVAMLQDQYGYKKAQLRNLNSALGFGDLSTPTLAKPVIAHVAWEGGGGHWSVVCGYRAGMLLYSDPYYGVGWLNFQVETVGGIKQPKYVPQIGARGHFSGTVISIA